MTPKANLCIKNIGQLATPVGSSARKGKEAMGALKIIEDAAVIVENGIITFVGKESELPSALPQGCKVLDAGGNALLPGFVDSHTHLVFGGYREDEFQWRLAGDSYMSIMERGGGIAKTMQLTRSTSEDSLTESALAHLKAMLSMGVTTVEAKSGYGMQTETELKQLRVTRRLQEIQPVALFSTFMGAHDIPPEYKGRNMAYIEYIIEDMLPRVKEEGLAEACDIFTEKGVFNHEETIRLLTAAKKMDFALKMHADEIVPFGGAELAASLGCLSADHLLRISDKGIHDLAEGNTVATLLPLTAFSLKAEYAPARKMIDSGCAVALASDLNPGSCFSASTPLLMALATIYMGMTIEETLTALTLNGAAALHRADRIGSIEVGKEGDFALLRMPNYKFLSYHFGMNLVDATIKGGVVYRNEIEQE